MLTIAFEGWFQCRLATDPDDFDHPRGESGWTFALPGEPDLDRVIRFQSPIASRSHTPRVVVVVNGVADESGSLDTHPLIGCPVELLDSPVFEGRNGDIAMSATEPIVPFTLTISGPGFQLKASDPIDLADPDEVMRRQPFDFQPDSDEVRTATGIANPSAYRGARRSTLQADLGLATEGDDREALILRISELARGGIRLSSLSFKLDYEFELRGENTWHDPDGQLGTPPSSTSPWRVNFWMGAWDADALCGYVKGELRVS
jgi:hypothetical protein